jgi:hypothetical protein
VGTQFVKVSSILARILQLKLLFQENGHSSFTPKRFMDDLGSNHTGMLDPEGIMSEIYSSQDGFEWVKTTVRMQEKIVSFSTEDNE